MGLSITNNTSFQITESSQFQLNKEFSTVAEIEDWVQNVVLIWLYINRV